MKNLHQRFSRLLYAVPALAIAVAAILPVFASQASASLITSRSIQMSDSTQGQTAVQYKVSFNSITTGNTGGIVVDFCDNDPIIGDTTCSLPTGFTLTASPTVSGQSTTAGCSLSTFTTVGTLNSHQTLTLTAASPVNFTVTPCALSFTINGVTNPTTSNHPFYARIYTYAAAAGATGYTQANPSAGGAILDSGGIALSTASTINVTAKVEEQLSFCVYTGSTGNCGTDNGVTLGNTNGVLLSTGPFVDLNTKFDVQTNASSGASVNVFGNTLTSGANTITAIPALAASSAGSDQFGMCVNEAAGTNLTPSPNYDGTSTAACTAGDGLSQTSGTGATGGAGTVQFAFRSQAQATYGDPIASEAAGSQSTGEVAMIGNVATTQTAGIYTTNLKFIATGTF